MRIPSRAAGRLALTGALALAALCLRAAPAPAAVPPERTLPGGSTFAFVKVKDAAELRAAFRKSQIGQLFDDPAVKPLRDDLSAKLEEGGKKFKEKIGVTIPELLELPQGAAWIAIQSKDDPKVPVILLLAADAGKNEKAMADVLIKATKQAEEAGSKLAEEKFKDATLTIIRSPKDDDKDAPPLVWTKAGSVFHVATDVDALKDLLSHAEGREESLADNESYKQVEKKVGEGSQATWFLDIAQTLRVVARAAAAAQGQGAKGDEYENILRMVGLNSLKAAGGSFTFGSGEFDQLSRTVVYAPGPQTGLLKAFKFPGVDLKPEPWVPAGVASYESFSWDLDTAYGAINDLAGAFMPGGLDNLEKALVPPGGGEPLSLKRDVFGPLGNRITVVGDFKKPITEDSQRVLVAVAVQDAKKFQATLGKILALAKAKPKTREFQGTTIYDVEFDRPAPPGAAIAGAGMKGKFSLAVAKGTLFAGTDPALVEQVIRTGGPALADSPGYQAVARQFPEQTSLVAYQRSEEQARLIYDLVKSGKFQKALQGANMAAGPGADKAADFIDPDKIPDFSVFAKYLAPAGSFGTQDEDGVTVTRFTLRKINP